LPARKWLIMGAVALLATIVLSAMHTDSVWDGVDVAVVGKYATDLGREPWTPFINVQGDLQLFVFTVAGLIGGFVIGYYWRAMFGSSSTSGRESDGSRGEGSDVPGL